MTRSELVTHLRDSHGLIVRNYGQHFKRATKRDLTVSHEAWHERYGDIHDAPLPEGTHA
jgi:hypothetical protein